MSFALAHQNKNKGGFNTRSTPVRRSPDHRVNKLPMKSHDSIVYLQLPILNQTRQRLMPSKSEFDFAKIGIQAKLKVSQPRDMYEQEADRVAEQIMRMSGSDNIGSIVSKDEKRINPKCLACEMDKDEKGDENINTSRKPLPMSSFENNYVNTSESGNIRSGGGSPLDNDIKEIMESRFGYDFSRIRIHRNTKATESAQLLNALAFTVGQDLVFSQGQYAPRTYEGQRLLAHELSHAIQQTSEPNPYRHTSNPIKSEASQVSNETRIVVGPTPRLRTAPMVARQIRTTNVHELSGPELDEEFVRVRDWLLGHSMIELDYAPASEYLNEIEKELRQRASGSNEQSTSDMQIPPENKNLATPDIRMAPKSSRPTIPTPANVSTTGPVRGPTSRAAPMTAAHAGGVLGEKEVAFALGERGFHFVVSPSGPGAHKLTGSGFDSIAYNPHTGEIWLIDNKATGALGNVEGKKATALGKNLEQSLTNAVNAVRDMPNFPNKASVQKRLEGALKAVSGHKPIPADVDVKLKVTTAGGYASGARNLPSGVDFEDVGTPSAREARRAEIATAKKVGVEPGRPASHVDTEKMRKSVGGAQTLEPASVPKRVRVTRTVRHVGGAMGRIGAALLLNYGMSKLELHIESKVFDHLLEEKMKELEPSMIARLNDQFKTMVELQLLQPGKPLYGNIAIQTTIYRSGDEDEVLLKLEIDLKSVSISTEQIELHEQKRTSVGNWLGSAPRDFISTTYSVALAPLSKEELRATLEERIGGIESELSQSSQTPETQVASQRRRDELSRQLRQLGAP